jgi:hypothetical protein
MHSVSRAANQDFTIIQPEFLHVHRIVVIVAVMCARALNHGFIHGESVATREAIMTNTSIFARALRPASRRVLAAVGLAMTAALPASSVPASAGLLDLLFGNRTQAPVAQPQSSSLPMSVSPQGASRRPLATVRKPAAQAHASAKPRSARASLARSASGERPVKTSGRPDSRPDVMPGPVGQFLLDPTLRRGDVVVTSEGLKIYVGSSRGQHEANEFVALSEATQFKAGGSPILAEIDKANILASPALVEEAGEALPKPVLKVEEKTTGKRDKRAALNDGKTRMQ